MCCRQREGACVTYALRTQAYHALPGRSDIGIAYSNQETIHKRRRQFFWIFDTPCPISAAFSTMYPSAILTNPHRDCRRRLLTAPKGGFYSEYNTGCMMRMLCPGFSAAAEVRTVRHSFITGWRFSYACYACRMIYVMASSKNQALCTTSNGCSSSSSSSSRPIDFTWIDRKHQIVRRVHTVA